MYYNGDIESWLKIHFTYANSNPCWYGSNLYFNGVLVTDVIIPSSITSIGDSGFCGCRSLTGVMIPDTITSIGKNAFYRCNGLTNITIPNSVTDIGDCAF